MKKIIFCIVHKMLLFSKIQNFSKSVSVFISEIKRQKSSAKTLVLSEIKCKTLQCKNNSVRLFQKL